MSLQPLLHEQIDVDGLNIPNHFEGNAKDIAYWKLKYYKHPLPQFLKCTNVANNNNWLALRTIMQKFILCPWEKKGKWFIN